jgi:hypothetical protein
VNSIGLYPRVRSDTSGTAVVSQAGAVGLIETVRVAGLDRALSQALAPWRKPNARHDPGKILRDLAIALAVGGDCLADVRSGLAGAGCESATSGSRGRVIQSLGSQAVPR